jgi:hypothetical protein
MKHKLSFFVTAGLTSVLLNFAPQAHADDAPKLVDKTTAVTITFNIDGGADLMKLSGKPCTDKPCVGFVRTKANRRGTYVINAPMFNLTRSSKLSGRGLPDARIMMNADNSLSFETTVNAQPMELRIEAGLRPDGSRVLQFNRDDLNQAITAENLEIQRKVETEPSIKKMLSTYGASMQVTSVSNSFTDATTPTETFSQDSHHNMIITHLPHTVTVTGNVNFKGLEDPIDPPANNGQNN